MFSCEEISTVVAWAPPPCPFGIHWDWDSCVAGVKDEDEDGDNSEDEDGDEDVVFCNFGADRTGLGVDVVTVSKMYEPSLSIGFSDGRTVLRHIGVRVLRELVISSIPSSRSCVCSCDNWYLDSCVL